MMAAYSQHPSQLQQHPGQQGPQQQHIQGHPGQPNAMMLQQMHPQQQAVYQQQMAARGNIHPAIQQQALLVRQRQMQQQMNGMGNPGMAFQNPNGAQQVRAGGLPNGMYAGGGPGGVPGGNIGAFAAQNPQLRGMIPPQMQQQLQQQQQQQQHIAAAQQFTMANQAAAQNNAHASAMGMAQQAQQMPLQLQQAHQMAAQRAAAAAVTQQKTLGLSVLRLHQFADHLAMFNPAHQGNDINHWRKFVSDFYSPIGVMRQQLVHNQKNEMKQFEITTNLLARYYFTLFESGIQNVQMLLELPREKPTANQGMTVECQKMSFIYWFDNGCHLVAQGELRVHFNQGQMIDMLDFTTRHHTEYVTRATMNDLLLKHGSPELMKMSPGGKTLGKRAQAQRMQPVQGPVENVTGPYGIPTMVLQLLENAETFSQMKELITYSHQNAQLTPTLALERLVQQQQQQQYIAQQHAAQHQAAQGMNGPVPRSIIPGGPAGMPNGPQQQGMQMTNSPSATDIRMGGVMSPHVGGGGATPSPAQNHMQAPGMVAQHSQHQHPTSNPSSQTSTTVGSANTSPNQTNKRRRASTTNVKTECEDGHLDGGAPNGVAAQKMKQSPRVNANKRTKLST